MKIKSYLFLLSLVSGITLKASAQVNNCYISFKDSGKLKMKSADKLPAEADHTRKLLNAGGTVDLTIVDGYRILYYNSKNVPFVNLKVETSKPENYKADKLKVLAELEYLNSQPGMETKNLVILNYNGYEIYGLSRNSIESGNTLGVFVMFPGENTIVYFYFNNMKPEVANFKTLTDYKGQRNDFIGAYTAHLSNCKGK